jgi:hypothetical protein
MTVVPLVRADRPGTAPSLRILVAVASYGRSNDQYLLRLIEEYGSMSFHVEIVILSNFRKQRKRSSGLRLDGQYSYAVAL